MQNSFLQSESWNFFDKPLANRVKPLDPVENPIEFETLHRKLLEATSMPYGTAISHLADKHLDGEPVPQD